MLLTKRVSKYVRSRYWIRFVFLRSRADWSGELLQPAMDHLLANADKPIPESMDEQIDEDDEEAVRAHIKKLGGAVDDSDAVAKSIKCSECGKIFRSQATASFHAEKSGHDQFEESTEEVSLFYHPFQSR